MKRMLFSVALLVAIASCVDARNPNPFGIRGKVDSIGSNSFTMDADGTEMKVFANSNTVFLIDTIKASAAYVVKGTEVRVSGSSDRPGVMNATLVAITPSTESISGTVKKVDPKFFILETDKETYKVYSAKFTKYVSGKPAAGTFGRRAPTKKEDASKIKVGAKVDVTPVTLHPDILDAWEINIVAEAEGSPGSR